MVVHGYLALQKHGFYPPYRVHGDESPDFQPRGSASTLHLMAAAVFGARSEAEYCHGQKSRAGYGCHQAH